MLLINYLSLKILVERQIINNTHLQVMCDIYLQQYKNSSLDDRDLISFNDLLGKLKSSYYYLHYQYQAEERCCSSRFYLTTEMLQQPAAQALHIGLILNTIKCYYMDTSFWTVCILYICILDTFFCQIKSFLRFRLAFVFGLQTYYLIDFSKIYPLKGLEPKNKG